MLTHLEKLKMVINHSKTENIHMYPSTQHLKELKIMNKKFNKQKGEQKLLYEQLHGLHYARYYKDKP